MLDFNLAASQYAMITNKEGISKGKFTEDGIYSKRIFGPSDTPTHYMCDCGVEEGAFNSGKLCNTCNTPVRKQNLLDRVGWIDLENYYVIHPMLYIMLEKLIGKRQLDKILEVENSIDQSGFVREPDSQTRVGKHNKWNGIGMRGLYNNFREIVTHFYQAGRKNPKKVQAYTVLYENWEKIWINKIAVTTHLLRPATIRNDKVFYDETNNNFTFIMNHLTQLKEYGLLHPSTSVDMKLAKIQSNMMSIFEKTMERLSRKKGYIRKEITGNRINYVSRSVILPAQSTIKINELWLPYMAFMEMWQMPIIHMLTQMYNCNHRDALTRWFVAKLTPSADIYSIIDYLVDQGCYVLFNRNPTINIGSILRMKVVRVKKDPTDLTTSTPNNVLKMLGGDYDGDTLNLIALFEPWLIQVCEKLDPMYMIFDRNHAYRYNPDVLLARDAIVGLNSC